MFENIGHFFKKIVKTEPQKELGSKDAAKERLHLVLMQDRANVSADFLELMKQEIIDVIKKYIVVDEDAIDVRLTNQTNEDGTNGAPSLYANIPIVNIKNDMMAEKIKDFEGVDFNKEMGIPTYQEPSKDATPKVIELQENYEDKEGKDKKDNEQGNKHDNKQDDKQDNKKPELKNVPLSEETEEVKEVFEEVDEAEDDDVTFDDLLKAAEAAEKMVPNAVNKNVASNENTKNESNNINKENKDNNKNTKDKQKKRK